MALGIGGTNINPYGYKKPTTSTQPQSGSVSSILASINSLGGGTPQQQAFTPGQAVQNTAVGYTPPTSTPTAGSTPTPGTSQPGMTTTAQINPDMREFLDLYKQGLQNQMQAPSVDPNLQTQVQRLGERLSADPTQRATELAQQRIRNAAEGERLAARENAARRGVLGTGTASQAQDIISDKVRRAQAGAAADIALGREGQLDQLVLGGQGIMAAPGQYELARTNALNQALLGGVSAGQSAGNLALGQSDLALRQQIANQQFANADREQNLAQQLALYRLLGL